MSKNYDQIAKVNIDISGAIVDEASFDNLLIVGPLPSTAPTEDPELVGVYRSLQDVINAGWSLTGAQPDPVAVAAQVAFAQSPAPSAIYIAPIQVDNNVAEDVTNTIERALGTPGWYVCCPAGVASNKFSSIAGVIEAQEKLFAYPETNLVAGSADALVADTYARTIGVYANPSGTAAVDGSSINNFIHVAFVAKWLAYQSGSETAAFKQLALVEPSELTASQMTKLDNSGMNYFITVGNRHITMNGKTRNGEWADIIRFRDWLKNDMQVRIVNLFIANPKIPYTDAGIALVQNQMLASLKAGQDAGGIAPDEYDELGDLIPAYRTTVPLAASISAADRASRRLTGCKFTARLSGAIHYAEINGTVSYTF